MDRRVMTEVCHQSGCMAVIVLGNGYCPKDGGRPRRVREDAERKAAERIRRSERAARGDRNDGQKNGKRRIDWSPRGATPGRGLGGLAKRDAEDRERAARVSKEQQQPAAE